MRLLAFVLPFLISTVSFDMNIWNIKEMTLNTFQISIGNHEIELKVVRL